MLRRRTRAVAAIFCELTMAEGKQIQESCLACLTLLTQEFFAISRRFAGLGFNQTTNRKKVCARQLIHLLKTLGPHDEAADGALCFSMTILNRFRSHDTSDKSFCVLFDAGFIGRISGRRAEFQRGTAKLKSALKSKHSTVTSSFSHEERKE